jgi:hypothetical protein
MQRVSKLIDAAQWMTNIQDADSVLESFFKECNLAGKEKCAIFSPKDPENSKKIYHVVLDTLNKAPLVVPGRDDLPPDILTHHDLIKVVVSAAYNPYPLFSQLATILRDLSVGNGTLLSAIKQGAIPFGCQSPFCKQYPWSAQCQNSRLVCLTHHEFPNHTNLSSLE